MFVAIVFRGSQGVLATHYVLKGVSVNSMYYCKVLCKLRADILCKLSGLRNEQIFFIHDKTYPHSSEFPTAFLDKLGLVMFPHLDYSHALAPSDFQSFQYLNFLGSPAFCE